jgi:TfoX/Sxy family transcriptional regulator of competence genes
VRVETLPEDILTDPEQLRQWARKAIRVAKQTIKPQQAKHDHD